MRAPLVAAVALLFVASGLAQVKTGGGEFSAVKLTAPPTNGWPTNGGNLYNQRYSPLTEINRVNVAQLKGVWRARLRGSGTQPRYSGFAQPLVYDGVAYVSTGANDVFALSIDTGTILWQFSAGLDPDLTSVCCGWNNKGVAISEDKVFIGRLDGRLVALDRATGKVVWSIQAERWQDNFSITAAPLYVNVWSGRRGAPREVGSANRETGMVIVGFAGGDRGTRGRMKAYDAKDGHLIWTFYTIPGPGEPGHETWPRDNDAWKYGGAAIWQTPAIDVDLGLVYFSTGNAGPNYNGAFRAGDNLYTASIVALDLATGKYRWHFQQVHHDIWDYDAANPVVLMDVRINGATRKAIAEVGKTGWAYILDRQTGKPLAGIVEKPVRQERRQATAKTQPFPYGDAVVPQLIETSPQASVPVNDGRIFTPFVGNSPTNLTPGVWGGASWPPSAYDPAQQRLFVCASSVVNGYTGGGGTRFAAPVNGDPFLGSTTTSTRLARSGIIAALDVTTNKLAWQQRWSDQCYSGTLATGGRLLFVGRNDGRLTSLDSTTGKQLWEFQTGAGMHAPVSTFMHKGRQYVLALSAGSTLIGSPRGDSVWLFGLNGTLSPVEPGATASREVAAAPPVLSIPRGTAAAKAPLAASAANLVAGQKLYQRTCVFCHGTEGKGDHGGGPLGDLKDFAAAMVTVTDGRNDMPPFRAVLTPEQIRDVSAYVVETFAGATVKVKRAE
jgi:alcohol dehydrogenase (cytochrome c)